MEFIHLFTEFLSKFLKRARRPFFWFPLTCWVVISSSPGSCRINPDPEYHKSVLGVDSKNFGKSVHCNKIFGILLNNNVLLTLFQFQITIEKDGPELIHRNSEEFWKKILARRFVSLYNGIFGVVLGEFRGYFKLIPPRLVLVAITKKIR